MSYLMAFSTFNILHKQRLTGARRQCWILIKLVKFRTYFQDMIINILSYSELAAGMKTVMAN